MKVDKEYICKLLNIKKDTLKKIENKNNLYIKLSGIGYKLINKTKEGRRVYYEIKEEKISNVNIIKNIFNVKNSEALYKYIILRIEDYNNNYEQPLLYFAKECNVSLRTLCDYNKRLIDYGFLIKDGKINKIINSKVDTIKVQKNNIDPKVISRLRNEFTKYIGRIYKETKCSICGNNKNLELHHLDKSFSVILGECINILDLNYNITTSEYNVLSNMMLGLQIKQEYKTLCKDCHSKYHELYVKQNKYKINKDNNLYKIIAENKLD